MAKKSAEENEIERQHLIEREDDFAKERDIDPIEGQWYAYVTNGPIYYGKLQVLTPLHFVLNSASWIPDTGRLSEFIKDPSKNAAEVEYVGKIIVPRHAVVGILVPLKGGEAHTK